MGQKNCITMLSLGIAAIALLLCSCGVTHTSLPTSQIGGTSNAASGPVLTAWWDPGIHGVRTVYGVAGAAYQGPVAVQSNLFSSGFVCMRGSIALLLSASGEIFSASIPRGSPVAMVTTPLKKPQVVFSPSCTNALVYTSGAPSALLIQNLSSSAQTLPLNLPSTVTTAIVADSGMVLMNLAGSDKSSSIQSVSPGATTSRAVTTLAQFGAMSFLPGRDTALLADSAANTIFEASVATGGISIEQIAGEGNGVSRPVAIAASADGRMAA